MKTQLIENYEACSLAALLEKACCRYISLYVAITSLFIYCKVQVLSGLLQAEKIATFTTACVDQCDIGMRRGVPKVGQKPLGDSAELSGRIDTFRRWLIKTSIPGSNRMYHLAHLRVNMLLSWIAHCHDMQGLRRCVAWSQGLW